jgi:hypothetical protein
VSADHEECANAARSWLQREGFDLAALAVGRPSVATAPAAPGPGIEFVPDLASYDHILVAYSSGKDSQACLLYLLELGVPREKIECQHHLVDGREGPSLMD